MDKSGKKTLLVQVHVYWGHIMFIYHNFLSHGGLNKMADMLQTTPYISLKDNVCILLSINFVPERQIDT